MRYIFLLLSAFVLSTSVISQDDYFRFSTLPDLPPNSGCSVQPGLAGPYTGLDDNVLIVAGGSSEINGASGKHFYRLQTTGVGRQQWLWEELPPWNGEPHNDAIFPWYIASQLPSGISGLLIAGIFSAAMSTLSSSMNSAATAYATDIHFRFGWNKNTEGLRIARIATLIIGITGILFAFAMATMDVKSLWDEFQKILGLVIGSLGGVFLLGLLTRRANYQGALIGIAASIVVQIFVGIYQPVHLTAYSATGVVSCFVAGYLGSLFFRCTAHDTRRTTHDARRRSPLI